MDVTIEKLIYGGEGLAHHAGSTVFVPFVLPAERAAILPTEQKKKFIRARLERVLDVSPERIEPRCLHFGVCGGCEGMLPRPRAARGPAPSRCAR